MHMRRRMAPATGVLFIASAVIGSGASASLFLPQDLRSQLAASEIVLEGRVDRVYQCPDTQRGLPRTCAAVSGATFLKGRADSGRVAVLFPGGKAANGRDVQMIGAPRPRAGETVIVSAIVLPGSESMLVLANFDGALLRRELDATGREVAANAVGRRLTALPQVGHARYAPSQQEEGAGAGAGGGGDAQIGGAPMTPAPPPPPLAWSDARRAVTEGLRAIAAARTPAKAARTIQGATGAEGGTP